MFMDVMLTAIAKIETVEKLAFSAADNPTCR
jgi:hypothetical protein